MRKFNPSSPHPDRAVQVWQIRIGGAMNRQTFTYKKLSEIMYGKSAAGVLDKILGHVAFYCMDEKLPPLTAIVVAKKRGTPGQDIPVDPKTMDKERERVYGRDWYDIYPPSSQELHASYVKHLQ